MNTFPDIVSDIDSGLTDLRANAKFEASKDHAGQAASELKEAALLKAREVKDTAMHKAEDLRRRVEGTVKDVRSRCEARTRSNPTNSLLLAFGAGLLLGFVVRR